MHKITSVRFDYYVSYEVPKDILESVLINSTCNLSGTVRLVLKPGHNLIQTGPYIFPPIRWLDSFEYNAEFDISCEVE